MNLQTVLSAVDLTPVSEREVEVAAEVCKSFEARLVLVHNLAGSGVHMAKVWEWGATHRDQATRSTAEKRLQEIAAQVAAQVPTEVCITRGPASLVLRQMAVELHADLLVLASHGWGDDDHDSLSERLLSDSPCPILTIQEGVGDRHRFLLRWVEGKRRPRVLVPTDFSKSATRSTAYAFDLARNLPLEVHLLHVARSFRTAETARRMLESMVPDDLWDRIRCHIRTGDPPREIVVTAHDLDVEMVMMGEHSRGLLRSLFTRDTAKELLHRAPCAVWFVPACAGT